LNSGAQTYSTTTQQYQHTQSIANGNLSQGGSIRSLGPTILRATDVPNASDRPMQQGIQYHTPSLSGPVHSPETGNHTYNSVGSISGPQERPTAHFVGEITKNEPQVANYQNTYSSISPAQFISTASDPRQEVKIVSYQNQHVETQQAEPPQVRVQPSQHYFEPKQSSQAQAQLKMGDPNKGQTLQPGQQRVAQELSPTGGDTFNTASHSSLPYTPVQPVQSPRVDTQMSDEIYFPPSQTRAGNFFQRSSSEINIEVQGRNQVQPIYSSSKNQKTTSSRIKSHISKSNGDLGRADPLKRAFHQTNQDQSQPAQDIKRRDGSSNKQPTFHRSFNQGSQQLIAGSLHPDFYTGQSLGSKVVPVQGLTGEEVLLHRIFLLSLLAMVSPQHTLSTKEQKETIFNTLQLLEDKLHRLQKNNELLSRENTEIRNKLRGVEGSHDRKNSAGSLGYKLDGRADSVSMLGNKYGPAPPSEFFKENDTVRSSIQKQRESGGQAASTYSDLVKQKIEQSQIQHQYMQKVDSLEKENAGLKQKISVYESELNELYHRIDKVQLLEVNVAELIQENERLRQVVSRISGQVQHNF
jgi:uncharacterized protein YlxW (UPF0749 family)